MVGRYFPLDEYDVRQRRVHAEMKRRGYETAVIWSRSGGSHERHADLVYLANQYSSASGQEPDNALLNARSFNALIMQDGKEPELHVDLPGERPELVAVKRVQWHYDVIAGVAAAVKQRKTHGPVAFVGSDFFPVKYWRQFEAATAGVDWVIEDDLVQLVRRIKSVREIECYREGSLIAAKALNRFMENLIACKSEAEAAASAADIIMKAGGAFLMLPCSHGDKIEYWTRNPLTGYSTDIPLAGDMVRAWLLGPIFQGYYHDPGRTAVAGGRPNKQQKELIESCANIVTRLVEAIKPGVAVMDVAKLGERLTAEAGGGRDQAAEQWPLYGHGLGQFWEDPYIGTKMCKPGDAFQPNMVFGVEAFLGRRGVGAAGFEQNIIITEKGVDLISTSPLIW